MKLLIRFQTSTVWPDKLCLTLYWVCDYLAMLGFKLIHTSKKKPWWGVCISELVHNWLREWPLSTGTILGLLYVYLIGVGFIKNYDFCLFSQWTLYVHTKLIKHVQISSLKLDGAYIEHASLKTGRRRYYHAPFMHGELRKAVNVNAMLRRRYNKKSHSANWENYWRQKNLV